MTFHLSGNEGWEDAKAVMLHNDKQWYLYVYDEDFMYYFKGKA
jgi:hypothetical protein